jgi:hypothetical protein
MVKKGIMGREALEGLSLKLQDFISVQDWK